MMKLGLYSYWRSSCSYRVRIVLNLKKLNYEYKRIDLLNLKDPIVASALDEKNPIRQIPVLEVTHDDNKKSLLVQSLPIMEWLEESYPDTFSIMPTDTLLRQKTRAMAEIINSGIQPLQNLSVLEDVERNGGDKVVWAKQAIDKGLTALEKMVKQVGGKFCVGDHITLVDCCLIPQFYNAKRFGLDVEKYVELNKIYNRCMEIDAFDKASPEKQVDCPAK